MKTLTMTQQITEDDCVGGIIELSYGRGRSFHGADRIHCRTALIWSETTKITPKRKQGESLWMSMSIRPSDTIHLLNFKSYISPTLNDYKYFKSLNPSCTKMETSKSKKPFPHAFGSSSYFAPPSPCYYRPFALETIHDLIMMKLTI